MVYVDQKVSFINRERKNMSPNFLVVLTALIVLCFLASAFFGII
jgi:hypothetical protein